MTAEPPSSESSPDVSRGWAALVAGVKQAVSVYASSVKRTLAAPAWQKLIRRWEDYAFIQAEGDRHRAELTAILDARMDDMYADLGLERER